MGSKTTRLGYDLIVDVGKRVVSFVLVTQEGVLVTVVNDRVKGLHGVVGVGIVNFAAVELQHVHLHPLVVLLKVKHLSRDQVSVVQLEPAATTANRRLMLKSKRATSKRGFGRQTLRRGMP